jgi:hypothetical protein
MNEAQITEKIKAYLIGIDDCFWFKEHGGIYGSNGIPDLIICYKGKFVALEVKTKGGKTTALQEAALKQIRAAGGIGGVVRSVEDVKRIIEGIRLKESGEDTKAVIKKINGENRRSAEYTKAATEKNDGGTCNE